ncbi:unnamed protein product [Staurois parvus]|uniref:Uncharacterized protein n=1 Tax=Staurois parvus TaxID=386267 RepID=A0ABN9D8Q7_9NEOB|nr:unnamed protein product [Staurois parvus]
MPSTGIHSVSSTPLSQSLHWPPLSVLHPSRPIHPLASTQCPPPPLPLPIPPLTSTQCPPLFPNPSLCQLLHCQSLH